MNIDYNMNITVQHVLQSFDCLAEKEKAEVAALIIRRASKSELPNISDEDFIFMAEELFLQLDNSEIQDARREQRRSLAG